MKKLTILILLLTTATAQAKPLYLFTDTQKRGQNTERYNPATWIFDFEKSIITVQTETEDVQFSFNEYEKVKSIEDNITYDRFILESGGAIYINTDIESTDFLQIIYCIEDGQYIFRSENKLLTNKN
jgi:hypothetical protein